MTISNCKSHAASCLDDVPADEPADKPADKPAEMPAKDLFGLFSDTVDSRADDVALRYVDGQKISYGELRDRIDAMAALLSENGIKYGERVGIYFLNHPDFVVAFFAVVSLGAVVVPINPLLKGDEINHILGDSGAESVIVHERLKSQLAACVIESRPGVKIFEIRYGDFVKPVTGLDSQSPACEAFELVEVESDSLSAGSRANFRTRIPDREDLAVLVYTSGTTGLPKGAMLSHANLLAAIAMKSSRMSVYPEDCLLVVLPLCHIYGMVVVMLGTLIEGGSLAIMESFDSLKALACIEENRVTILPAVPAMYQFMAMELEKNSFDLSSLKFGVVGGSSIPPELIESVEKAFGCPIREGYAMTESACVATLTPLLPGAARSGSAGPAIDGVEIAILGEDLEPLPGGRENIGQVAVAGANVMQGYYNLAEASREAFHGRFFLTGDLGWLDEDGYLYIVGRTKELIIRGGQNIYPRELELAILKMPGVADVAVVGVPDKFMGERVKAVIVRSIDEHGGELTEDSVKAYCSEHLAQYKVPRLVEFREGLPRNSTGKVLKRLLMEGRS